MTPEPSDRVREVFRDDALAARYGRERFPPRRLARERKTIARLLTRLAPGLRLDLACGAGRFGDQVAAGGPAVAADASAPMLREAAATGAYSAHVQADALRLPFRDGAFAGAICIRLLQHLDAADRRTVLAELRRVSRGAVIVSFFDAGTLEAWRARGRRKEVRSRRAIPLAEFEADCAAAGWRVAELARKLGRLTEHVFALLEPLGGCRETNRGAGHARCDGPGAESPSDVPVGQRARPQAARPWKPEAVLRALADSLRGVACVRAPCLRAPRPSGRSRFVSRHPLRRPAA